MTELTPYLNKLLTLKRQVAVNIFAIGGLLKAIRDDELWKEQTDSWHGFLGLPEISYSQGFASQSIKVFESFSTLKVVVDDIEPYKLYLIADKVQEEPDKAEDWIEDARQLSRSDLKVKLGKVKEYTPLEDRIDEFLGTIQFRDYFSDENNCEEKFKKLLLDFSTWKKSKKGDNNAKN